MSRHILIISRHLFLGLGPISHDRSEKIINPRLKTASNAHQHFGEFGFWSRRVAVVAIGYHALGLNLRPSLPTDVPSAANLAVINHTARGTRNWA